MINADLATVWAFIIAFAVFGYVVLDGFDLGIGILFPAFKVGADRDAAMNAIAPVWDGNETWLVLGGGGLFAAFPLAYAILMPAMYPPIIAMLLGLVFRGVAFEYRWRDPAHRRWWDIAFTAGSITAAFAQGVVLGALLQGVKVSGRAYGGAWLDWLTPFSVLTGVSVVIGYALLGATWLIAKTEGRRAEQALAFARWLGVATLVAVAAVSLATPFLNHDYYSRWFRMPGLLLTAPVPMLVAVIALLFWRSLGRGAQILPFVLTIAMFALCFVGLGISMYPYIVPATVTIWQAAAPESSQVFMLIGVGIMLPLILGYTAWGYWVFRGKVGEGYH
ncbi:cytochrome d ubiquinol oxidase subunit II [Sphingomonas sp. HMWF008]|nr:cytochrome d ubiquinol oxidase subunit II [Sphingomonas sp. HMWF008]